ncbi:MAG: hypothetical protein K6F91_02265 [Ruminococcus sp.]|nr:hypothetical protein [Ruminococcus sp.]
MIKHIMAALAAIFAMSLTACGTITPPQAAVTTTTETTTTTVPMLTSADDSSEPAVATTSISEDEKKQLAANTFIAEFYDSPISFVDSSRMVAEVMKKSGFENSVNTSNGVQKITLKGDNGSGRIDVMCIDISKCSLERDIGYIAETVGEYCYEQTVGAMAGVTDDDFVSNYRMTNTVMAKAKYQQYGSVQKTDGTASQFGYAEAYAVLSDNKLTVVSGQFLSTDMMERQTFSKLMTSFREKISF